MNQPAFPSSQDREFTPIEWECNQCGTKEFALLPACPIECDNPEYSTGTFVRVHDYMEEIDLLREQRATDLRITLKLTSEQRRTLDRTADNFCTICSPEWVSGIPHSPNDPLLFAHDSECIAHLLCELCKEIISKANSPTRIVDVILDDQPQAGNFDAKAYYESLEARGFIEFGRMVRDLHIPDAPAPPVAPIAQTPDDELPDPDSEITAISSHETESIYGGVDLYDEAIDFLKRHADPTGPQ